MALDELKDSDLIRSYLAGSEASLERLIKRHQQKIYSYIIARVHDEMLAEDIFQDTFIKVIRTLKRGKYNEEGKFLPWVLRISHNLIIDHFRRNKRMPKVDTGDEFDIFDVLPDGRRTAEMDMVRDQVHADLRRLIQMLPKEQREVLIMRHYAEMSFKEIAQHTDVSINTALGRMRYALINIRKLMEEHNVNLSIN